jgi:hypothetical protein
VHTTNCGDIIAMPNILTEGKVACGNGVEKMWKTEAKNL